MKALFTIVSQDVVYERVALESIGSGHRGPWRRLFLHKQLPHEGHHDGQSQYRTFRARREGG